MRIQINDRIITVYSKGMQVSSTIETTQEIDDLITQLEDYIRTQKTPEMIAIEEANEERDISKEREQQANEKYVEAQHIIANIMDLFEPWEPGQDYLTDNILNYGNRLYRVLQDHTSQADWVPDETPSLYVDITTRQIGEETGEIPEWEQPGSTNPYNTGEKVIFEGIIYESTIDGNVWSPTDYPQGWKEVTE